MGKLEKQIEQRVVRWAKTVGVLAIKFSPRGEVGWPDRIFIFPGGVHVWVEFKAKGKTPTPMQLHRMAVLNKQGVNTMWGDSSETIIHSLKRYL